ncbi:MAG: hypothetical protein ABI567_05285 [Gammaproteobacteria bacterium]
MIATDSFVFLHLHKSGGSFANDCIRQHLPGARELGYHLPRSLIPTELAALPVLGLVRNPWSYYVSWYSFQKQRPRPNALFRVLSNEGQLDFDTTIHNMLDLGQDDVLLARLVELLPAQYGNGGLNLPGFALKPIRSSGLGFYSFLYRYMYDGGPAAAHIGLMEDLPHSLLALLARAEQPVSTALRAYALGAPRRNPSEHAAYASYYQPPLRDRIASQDAAVIDAHGYRFGA